MSVTTLDIQEAATKLPSLFEQPQHIQEPVWITRDNAAKPVAVIIEFDEYDQMKQLKWQFYQMKLTYLQQWLVWAERQWEDESIRLACIKAWQENIESLWELAPQSAKNFCASLVLSTRLLDIERFTSAQISALKYSISLLHNKSKPLDSELEEAHRRLIQAEIPPMVSMPESVIQSYLDEL